MAPCPSTRRPHSLLKVSSEVAIRVPPAQSCTVDEQLASASSGSRIRKARVTLVSRVPNRNTETRLRASVTAWRKCRNSRVYSLIEPEISSSATIGDGRSMRPRWRRSTISPPERRLARRVRRRSSLRPRASGAKRRVRISACGSFMSAIARVARAISAALICAKSFFCRISRSETDNRISCSSGCCTVSPGDCGASASCTRRDAGGGVGLA